MIRKWSYIRNSVFNFSNSYQNIISRYKFKVFRLSTRFKIYSIGKTNIIRKVNTIRKRTTSSLPISIISHQWSILYIRSKQLNRYLQGINQFNLKFPLISVKYLFNKSSLQIVNIFNVINVKLNLIKVFKNVIHNAYLYTSLHLDNSLKIIPGLTSIEYTNMKYPTNSFLIKKNQCINSAMLSLRISLLFRRVLMLIIINTSFINICHY